MNFIRQLKEFHERSYRKISPNATAVYLHLFMVDNYLAWAEWFEVSDSEMVSYTGIKRHESILRAINSLKQNGFIDYIRGGAHKATQYRIIPLSNSTIDSIIDSTIDSTIDSIIDSTKTKVLNTPPETAPVLESSVVEVQKNDENALINNKNYKQETINNKRARGNRTFVPPTLDEVQDYILEKGLHVSAKQFLDYFTVGNWTDAKGNKVKNWKQKLLTWEKFADRKQQAKPDKQERQMQAIQNVMAYFEGGGGQ